MAARASTVFFKGVLVSFIAACYFGMPAHAATITVDTTAATGTASECSLQDALTAANTNTAVNGCLAGDSLPVVDVVQLPAGTFAIGYAFNIQPDESVSIRGAGMASTILNSVTVSPTSDAVPSRVFELRDLALINSTISVSDSVSTFTMDHVGLNATAVYMSQQSKAVTSSLTNINASNGSLVYSYANMSNPGDLTVGDSTLQDTGLSTYPAIYRENPQANSRVTVTNSIISGYKLGLLNQECAPGVSITRTFYVTNSLIGGGGMQEGIVSPCGHLVIDSTTFHDIQGSAIVASAAYQPVDSFDGGLGTTYYCSEQQSSRIEVSTQRLVE